MLRGAHRRRGGVDVEGGAGQGVAPVGQAHGAMVRHRVGDEAHGANRGHSEKGRDPSRDCTGSGELHLWEISATGLRAPIAVDFLVGFVAVADNVNSRWPRRDVGRFVVSLRPERATNQR
jgi:hypothetical protein